VRATLNTHTPHPELVDELQMIHHRLIVMVLVLIYKKDLQIEYPVAQAMITLSRIEILILMVAM
jgi:hypothetical protein